MRTLKLTLIVIIAIALMIVMAANMSTVELHLLPEAFAPGLPTLSQVPVALIIVVSLMAGLVLGMLMELLREAKYRNRLSMKRREVSELRDQNAKLVKRLAEKGDDVTAITT